METKSLYKLFKTCSSVSIDTRTLEKDALFFGLKGPRFDGNKLAEEALSKGAKYAVVDDPALATSKDFILVKDSLRALQQLALFHRKTLTIPVIGITGSNGKTTTKELVDSVLSTTFNVLATKGNLNNHIGVPLTLLEITAKHQIAIIEMGANHRGEIDFLCSLCVPTYGLITNIGSAHLEGFGSRSNIIETKRAVYNHVCRNNGLLFVNASDRTLTKLIPTGCSTAPYLDESKLHGELAEGKSIQLRFTYQSEGFKSDLICSHLSGHYNLANAMAAVAIGKHFGVSDSKIKEALESYQPTNNRSQWVNTGENRVILDAYNANPTSTKAALVHFFSIDHPKKMVILGDMLELGSFAESAHIEMIKMIEKKGLEAWYIGPIYQELHPKKPAQCFLNTQIALKHLKENPLSDRLILLKGSRSIGLEKLMEAL